MQKHGSHSKPLARYPNAQSPGGAAPWLVASAVVLALLGAMALWGTGRGTPQPAGPDTTKPTPGETDSLDAELAELGDRFAQVMDNNRDAQPLIDRIDRFLADHPDVADAHTLRGQVTIYARRPKEALASLERSLELEPRQAEVRVLAGSAAMGLEHYEQAIKHYETALSIDPGKAINAVYLANAQQRIGEDDLAVTTLLTALRRDSRLHSAYALLSDIYAKQNKVALALDQIGRALENAQAENTAARTAYTLKRAALLRRDNRPAEAIAALEALPPQARVTPDVLRDTATGWAMLGKPAMAAELYERVLAVDPSNDLAAAEAARWWLKADNPDAARRNLQALRRINPRHEAVNELDVQLKTPAPADTQQE